MRIITNDIAIFGETVNIAAVILGTTKYTKNTKDWVVRLRPMAMARFMER